MSKTMSMALVAAVALAAAVSVRAQEGGGDLKAGAGKIAMCIGCHGIVGYQSSFPQVHKVPMISGQNARYIVAALSAYKKGERRHPTMRGVAESLTEQDMADLAAYYAQHGHATAAPAAAAPDAQVAALLQRGACMGCHGANFSKPIEPSYPKIGGQHGDYLFVALKAYKTHGNPQIGRANPIMGSVATQFSDAELKRLAGYLGSLQGELQTVPQSRFR